TWGRIRAMLTTTTTAAGNAASATVRIVAIAARTTTACDRPGGPGGRQPTTTQQCQRRDQCGAPCPALLCRGATGGCRDWYLRPACATRLYRRSAFCAGVAIMIREYVAGVRGRSHGLSGV